MEVNERASGGAKDGIMKIWRFAAMVLLFGAANALCGNYDGMLEIGMTYRQASQMLGEKGEKINEYFFLGRKWEIYRWGTLVKGFMNGSLQPPASVIGMGIIGLGMKQEKKSVLEKFEEPDVLPSDNKDVTAEKFEAVKIDMTSESVFKILGKTNIPVKICTDDTVTKFKKISFYQWFNEFSPGSVNAIFLDNELVGKGEVGLYPAGSSGTDPAAGVKVGMNSEKAVSILGNNVKCRKYINKTMMKDPDIVTLCRWWFEDRKMNVIFLRDRVIGTWNYPK